jgi:hypothetical protein
MTLTLMVKYVIPISDLDQWISIRIYLMLWKLIFPTISMIKYGEHNLQDDYHRYQKKSRNV